IEAARSSRSEATTGLSRAWEAQIDLRGPRVGPARGHDLRSRVELDPFGSVHVKVAEQAGLPAPEAVVRDGHRDRHVDADHAGVDLELELASRTTIPGEDR